MRLSLGGKEALEPLHALRGQDALDHLDAVIEAYRSLGLKGVFCHKSFLYQAASWSKPRRIVAKVEHHPGYKLNLSLLRGAHSVKIGSDNQHIHTAVLDVSAPVGRYRFRQNVFSTNSWGDFLLGMPRDVRMTTPEVFVIDLERRQTASDVNPITLQSGVPADFLENVSPIDQINRANDPLMRNAYVHRLELHAAVPAGARLAARDRLRRQPRQQADALLRRQSSA